jgi:hypothetical protein
MNPQYCREPLFGTRLDLELVTLVPKKQLLPPHDFSKDN